MKNARKLFKRKYLKMKKTTDGYTTYLELQLDKVTAACSASQKYAERIDLVSGQVTTLEEKIANLTKVIKLIQSYTEGQEQEIQKLHEEIGHKPSELPMQKIDTQTESILKRLVFYISFKMKGNIREKTI